MASGYKSISAGEKPPAATINDYWSKQVVMVFSTTSDRDTQLSGVLREGMVCYVLNLNSLQVYSGSAWSTIGPVHGAGSSYTPVVVQGATPSVTVLEGAYWRSGRRVSGSYLVRVTSAGTSSNLVTVSLPVTASSSNSRRIIGEAFLYDQSTSSFFSGMLVPESTTVAKILLRTGSAQYVGTTSFTAALANLDEISFWFDYEAAADA